MNISYSTRYNYPTNTDKILSIYLRMPYFSLSRIQPYKYWKWFLELKEFLMVAFFHTNCHKLLTRTHVNDIWYFRKPFPFIFPLSFACICKKKKKNKNKNKNYPSSFGKIWNDPTESPIRSNPWTCFVINYKKRERYIYIYNKNKHKFTINFLHIT